MTREEETKVVELMKSCPCITINRAKSVEGYDTIFEGEMVGVNVPSKRYGQITIYGSMHYYSEENKYYVQSVGYCIKASFGAEDIMEIKARKYCPKVSEGEKVCIIEDWGEKGIKLRVMKATRCNSMYSEACVFVDVE